MVAAADEDQFERAGLLEGLDAGQRSVRVAALRALAADGVPVGALVDASRQGRLAQLVLEKSLVPAGKYTLEEVAARAGVGAGELTAWFRAIGRGIPVAHTHMYGDDDVLMGQRLREYGELSLNRETLFAAARVWGRNVASLADAMGELIEEALLSASDDPDLLLRYSLEVRRLGEIEGRIMSHVLATLLVQRLGSGAISAAGARHLPLRGERQVAVCFADLVGFTRLGEKLTSEMLGEVADELAALATDVVEQPVRVLKTIGDAVMMICAEPVALVETALTLVDAAGSKGLPPLRAAVTYGPAVSRGGDWFGRPINLASRMLSAAAKQQVLVPGMVREVLPVARYTCALAGEHAFRGVEGPMRLYSVRRV